MMPAPRMLKVRNGVEFSLKAAMRALFLCVVLARCEGDVEPAAAVPDTDGGEDTGAEGALQESDLFLGGERFSKNESDNLGTLYKWLDDIFWTDLWDSGSHRQLAYEQLDKIASLSIEHLPSLAFGSGQAIYSYFWFKDNGPDVDLEAARRSVQLHEVSLAYSGCDDLTMGVGAFLAKACSERWLYLIMLCAEIGADMAARRVDVSQAAELLQKGSDLFGKLVEYPFFNFRGWRSLYDINTNSHVFPGPVNRPIWPSEVVPLAGWLEAHAHVFRQDLDYILQNNMFDSLYFAGHVSMTQFSPKRESWAPLNLIHNKQLAPHACQVANRSCELLLTRPEIARCDAKDVGAAFARLLPGMGIKPHFWNAPPRLGVHLGLRTSPGAGMMVADQRVEWADGRAVVFDDTYIHSVQHRGTEARYLLIAWFCHPCDPFHAAVPADYSEGLCPQ